MAAPAALGRAHAARGGGADAERGEAVQEVVADHHAERGVVGGAVHIRAVLGRGERDGEHPGRRHGGHDQCRQAQMREPPPQRDRCRHQVDQSQRGKHCPRLQHLRLEADPDPHTGEHQRAQSAVPGRALCGLGRKQYAQREGGVLHRCPEEPHGDRGQQERRTGDQRRVDSGPAAHQTVQDQQARHSLDDLRQSQRPRVESKDASRECLRPQESRQFVERDGISRVERAVEEGLPALRHAASGVRVEHVVLAVLDPPGVEHGRQYGDDQQHRARVHGLAHRRSPGRATSDAGGAGGQVEDSRSHAQQSSTSREPATPKRPVSRKSL